jgi:hypothetical protein
MQRAGDIRGRNDDAKRFPGSLYIGMEIVPFNPGLIPACIGFLWVVTLLG